MYLDPPIRQFIDRWWQKCLFDEDPFDRFVSAWIVMLVLARAHENCSSGKENVPESDLVQDFFANIDIEPIVLAELELHRVNFTQLAERRGTEYRNPVIDESVPQRRNANSEWARAIRTNAQFTKQHAQTTAGILCRIRNNLFHGKKMYDEARDTKLLEVVNPFLIGVLRRCLEAER